MKVKDMDILQHNLGKSKQKSFLTYPEKLKFDPRPTTEREISESWKQSFLSGVRTTLPKATFNISFSLPQCEDIPPSLEDIAREVNSCSDNSNVNNLFTSKLSFNDAHIDKLEKATRNQVIYRNRLKQVTYRNRLKPVKCRLHLYYWVSVNLKNWKILNQWMEKKKWEVCCWKLYENWGKEALKH